VGDANKGAGLSSHSLSLKKLTKRYGQQAAIEDVSIDVARGKFVTLLGPSGSGKTTILMTVAGFVPPTSGQILLDDRDITQFAPERRNFGMVFQGYALFPHMTVEENVRFPLRVRGVPLTRARTNVTAILDLVQLGGLARRLTNSGAAAALARALVFQPD
jgi:putative spermidine/putrescine transport system ATP-binding protein